MSGRCFIDGEEVLPDSVAKRVMNFGQSIAGLVPKMYELRIRLPDVIRVVADADLRTRHELMGDASNGDVDEITYQLVHRNWPALAELATQDPVLFVQYVGTYLLDELLDGVVVAPAAEAKYQINSVSEMLVCRDEVVLRGQCYQSRGEEYERGEQL